jgi:hypothetical protein
LEWSLVGRINLDGCQYDTRALEISYSNLGHRAISTKISGSLEGRRITARISRTEIIMKRVISSDNHGFPKIIEIENE